MDGIGTLSAVIYFFFNLVTHSGQGAPYSTRPCMTPGSQKSHGDVWRPARPVKRDSAAFLACPSCPMTTADDSDKEAHQSVRGLGHEFSARRRRFHAPADTVGIAKQAVDFTLIRTLAACQLQRVGTL